MLHPKLGRSLQLGSVLFSALLALGCASGSDVPLPPADASNDASGPDGADADIADARPDADLSDACVPQWVDVINNGDFDLGASHWTANSSGPIIIRMQGAGYPWTPQSGTWAALFLGGHNVNQLLEQPVTIPAATSSLRLSLYRCFVTQETSTTTAYDTLAIQLRSGLLSQNSKFQEFYTNI